MHQTLKQSYGVHVTRDGVMQIFKEIDPNGTEERKWKKLQKPKYFSAGPNATWHMDGSTNSSLTVFLSMAALMVFQEGYCSYR